MIDDEPYCPIAEISASEFEVLVGQILALTWQGVPGSRVTLHDKITVADGDHNLDATVRWEQGGVRFLMVVEAKRHKYAIKRGLVEKLYGTLHSTDAHKGLMVATTTYQSGAIRYADTHNIALATVTDSTPPTRWAADRILGPLSVVDHMLFVTMWTRMI